MSLLALALVAASSADTLVVGTLTDPVSLEPHRATDAATAAVVSNVCETLVRFREDGMRPEAALATTWASADGRRWTFTLRPGVRFQDGAPLDAEAVVANLENLRAQKAFSGRAERVGPLVVAITLDRPNTALLATLSQPFFALQSPRELAHPSGRAVGTGPFRIASVRPGTIELVAHHEYWGGVARLRHVVFRRLPTEAALLQGLLDGSVDVTSAIGHERIAQLAASEDVALDSQTGLNVAFLCLNNERPPFDDPRVRHALARAIDRDALVSHLLGGHGEPARNPLPPSLWGYGTHTKEIPFDRAGARRRLAEAGATRVESTLLTVDSPRPYMPAPLRLAAELRLQLQEVGMRVRPVPVATWAEYVDRARRGDFDMVILGWQADTADPNDFLSTLLGSESIGTTNRSRYHSPGMDALLKRGRMTANPGERLAIYREAQQLFQEDMPWIPLYHLAVFTAHRREVAGLALTPTGLLRYEKVWKKQ